MSIPTFRFFFETGQKISLYLHSLSKQSFDNSKTKKECCKGLLPLHYKSQMLRTHGYPKLSLTLNDLKNDSIGCGVIVEDACISLFPNFPTNKHGEECHCLPV
jgi:hypothetical protein